MAKSRDAFRTISEVAETLDTPAHVLRFWESKFKQIKPVKRAGGRRYYRPDDLALLAAIKDLLHLKGNSIKDTQRYIRETGVREIVAEGHRILDILTSLDDNATVESHTIDAPSSPIPPQTFEETDQPDLFAGMEMPPGRDTSFVAPNTPTPDSTAPNPTPQAEAPAPTLETKSTPTLPAEPAERTTGTSRILATLYRADTAKLRHKAKDIAPLVHKLSALRDELHHPW